MDAVKGLISETALDKGIDLVECEAVVDHVHLLLRLREESDLPAAMKAIKGVSSRKISERFPELKLETGVSNFWQAGYGSKIVPPEAAPAVQRYIQTQWERLEDYDR